MGTEPEIESLGRSAASAKPDFYSRDILTGYNALRIFEGDFDKAQGQLRAIGSAWLLAGIGATGLIIIQEVNHTTTPNTGLTPEVAGILRQALLFVIGLGLSSIWKLDQKVYQNLLHNVFALGYWIEYKYPTVPPIRMTMYHSNYDITDSLGEFYSKPVFLILICAIANCLYATFNLSSIDIHCFTLPSPYPSWKGCSALLAIHIMLWCWTAFQARGWGRLRGLLPDEADFARDKRKPPPKRKPFPDLGP